MELGDKSRLQEMAFEQNIEDIQFGRLGPPMESQSMVSQPYLIAENRGEIGCRGPAFGNSPDPKFHRFPRTPIPRRVSGV